MVVLSGFHGGAVLVSCATSNANRPELCNSNHCCSWHVHFVRLYECHIHHRPRGSVWIASSSLGSQDLAEKSRKDITHLEQRVCKGTRKRNFPNRHAVKELLMNRCHHFRAAAWPRRKTTRNLSQKSSQQDSVSHECVDVTHSRGRTSSMTTITKGSQSGGPHGIPWWRGSRLLFNVERQQS